MLVLLPPSETKHTGGDGGPLDLATLTAPELTPVRTELVEALVKLSDDLPASRAALGQLDAHRGEFRRRKAGQVQGGTVATGRLGLRRGEQDEHGVPQSSRSTMTGAWSLAPLPLRSSRSISAPVTRPASAGEPSTKSMRMPSRRGKRSCV